MWEGEREDVGVLHSSSRGQEGKQGTITKNPQRREKRYEFMYERVCLSVGEIPALISAETKS